jgi:very-short-patch-repair endonuclease
MNLHTFKSITQLCRELRQRATPSEKLLWTYLRNRQLNETKFYRQKPIIFEDTSGKKYFYIADFYSASKRLVIELDGPIHIMKKDYDDNRDIVMVNLGLKVLRIKNKEMNNIERVLEKIRRYL